MPNFLSRVAGPSFLTLVLTSLLNLTVGPIHALENGVARTPPMGWNPWNVFREEINEALIKEMADKFISTGLAEAGYKYILIDNGWYVKPNANVCDLKKFPSGIKALSAYMHERGLKIGLYTGWDAVKNPTRDANQWAAWDIDYIKHDAWQTPSTDPIWAEMSKAVLATKRPIVYSVHFSDRAKVFGNPNIVNMWRFTNDLVPYYNRATLPPNLSWGVTTIDILDTMSRVAATTKPGTWADADMIMVEQGKQTMDEWKTAFALNCILPSPMILSSDVRSSPKEILDIFLNKELIAVNQDTAGHKTWKVRDDGAQEVWARKLSDSSLAVVFFNTSATEKTIPVTWNELKMTSGNAKVRNLWTHQDVGLFMNTYSPIVPIHGTSFLKITPERFVTNIHNSNPRGVKAAKLDFSVTHGASTLQIIPNSNLQTIREIKFTLANFSGKIIRSQAILNFPKAAEPISINIPATCKSGMYIVSLKVFNPATHSHSEIQKKIFIKR